MKRNPLTIIVLIFITIPLYAETIHIQIKPGWNGICVPVNITQQAISDYVNRDQVSEIKAMINGKWIYYRNQPDDELTQFHPGYGYMVKAKKTFQLSFEGSPVGYPSLVQGDNFVCLPTDNESTVNELLSRYRSKNWGIQRIGAYDGHWGPGWGSANGTIFDAFTQIEPHRGYTVKVTKVGEAIEDTDPVDQPEHLDTFSNSLGMTFVYIEAGSYTMGSPSDEPGRSSYETQHYVKLSKGFFIQTTEVTNQQFVEFLNAVNKRGPSGEKWFDTESEDPDSHIQGTTGNFNVEAGYENHPLIEVSWYGATAMAEWLSQKETQTYRLPTEAEWEYAARAGTTTPFSFGNCLSTDDANYNGKYPLTGCPTGIYRSKTVISGTLSANAWGLYDMHGNVWEWCSDWYGSYPTSTVESPVTDPVGPESGSCRVGRGGGWSGGAGYCRSADRDGSGPGGTSDYLGFRLVCAPRTVTDSNRK
jgi:formylglycine-generating enzyme required for sulfatase activity